MKLLRSAFIALALCSSASVLAEPGVELTVTPAWGGWTRPGRPTEVDVRIASSDVARRLPVSIDAGRQTLHASAVLEPGRPLRLHVPVATSDGLTVRAGEVARNMSIARSESPLLAIALHGNESAELAGFHAVAIGADDLPRNVSAYASIDALAIDATTLGALDERQLSALTSHVAQCGRTLVLDADPRVQSTLRAAAGCGGQALVLAPSLQQGLNALEASLANTRAADVTAVRPSDIGPIVANATWQHVVVLVAVYFIAAALALGWLPTPWLRVGAPIAATLLVFVVLHALTPAAELVVWSEAESGAHYARYRAWQTFSGTHRGESQLQVATALASVMPCDSRQRWHMEFDAISQQTITAVFDTRLFHQTSMCYAGELATARQVRLERPENGAITIRNAGTTPWPAGAMIIADRVLDLPPLAPGASALLTASERDIDARVLRLARSRASAAGAAALWRVDSSTSNLPAGAKGWLLVTVPST